MSDDSIAAVLKLAEERGLSHANFGMFEVNGTYRSKRYNIRHLKKAMTDGIPWLAIPSGLDPADGPIPSNPFVDPAQGYSDGVLRLDPESCREFPLDSGGAGLVLLGNFLGDLAAHCPRSLLIRELERLSASGYDLYGGFELEGAVLAETPRSIVAKRPLDVATVAGFDKVYSFSDQTGNAAFIDEVTTVCTAMGLPVDTIHAEFTDMLEVGMQPAVGVRVADNAGLYKSVAKIVGARHDALVSFMARRSHREQGCGAHINVSLRRAGTDEGVFYDAQDPDRLSEVMRHFLGGLSRYLPDFFLLLAPNLNSFKRYQPGLFTPLNNAWGINNKTVALRALNATPASARIEVRPAGADVSAHLGLLAVVAAGRLGIEQALEPPAPVAGNGWAAEGQPELPLEFAQAIDQFDRSEVVREVLGDGFVDVFVGDRRHQLDAFSKVVTDWELALFGNL